MKRVVYIILILVFLLSGIVFAKLNAELVELNYYFGSKQIALSLILILTLILGAILGIISSTTLYLSHRRENIKLKKTIELAEKEINNLRSIPIRDKH